MYPSDILDKYSDLLLWGLTSQRRAPLRKSGIVLVSFDVAALPLAEVLVGKLHERGMVPVPRQRPTWQMEYDFYSLANPKRLSLEIPGEREFLSRLGGAIHLLAPEKVTHLADVDPEQLLIARKARGELRGIPHRRELAGEYTSVTGLYPSTGLCDAAGMSLEEYAEEIKRGCLLHRGTPVTDWKLLTPRLAEVAERLNRLAAPAYRVRSESMDLLLRTGQHRRWFVNTGRNVPSFEISLSPDWREGPECLAGMMSRQPERGC